MKTTIMDSKEQERSKQSISILNQLFTAYLILFEPFTTVLKLMGVDRIYREIIQSVYRLKHHRQPLDIFIAVYSVFCGVVLSVMIVLAITPECG